MGFFHEIYLVKWYIVAGLLAILTWMLRSWFTREARDMERLNPGVCQEGVAAAVLVFMIPTEV